MQAQGRSNPWLEEYVSQFTTTVRKFGEWEKRSIEEVLQEFGLELIETPSGLLKACCPFHDDRSPSFLVGPDTQRCWCASCWVEGGDVIAFVQKMRACSFQEALPLATVPIDGPDAVMRRMLQAMEIAEKLAVPEFKAVLDRMRLLRRAQGDEQALMLYTRFALCQTKSEVGSLLTQPQFLP